LRKIPGANIPNIVDLSSCHNPTFSATNTGTTNTLALKDPNPLPCDHKGPTQCVTGTGGAQNQSTPVSPSARGGNGGGAAADGGSGGGAGAGATGSTAAAAAGAQQQAACDPDTGCPANSGALANTNGQQVNGIPLASAASLGDGLQVTLMIVAAVLLLGLGLAPPLISQAFARRRERRDATP
jgi:hypothetical protein